MNEFMVVHLVEDDAAMRRVLVTAIEAAGLQVRVFDSAEEFLTDEPPATPGCLLLDLSLPGLGGVDLLQRLRSQGNEMPAVIISGTADVSAAVRCMKLGALELLQKPFGLSDLLTVVQTALQTSAEAHRQRRERQVLCQRLGTLTPREKALLQLIIDGKSNKQIAAELKISIKTVANHRARLMAKTGAVNGPDLVRLTLAAGT